MLLLADAQRAMRLLHLSVATWIVLVVVLLVMAGVLYWLRLRFLEDAGPAAEGGEMLSLARNLHLEGDLTEEEYRSIKGRLLEHPRDATPTGSKGSPNDSEGDPQH